MAELKRIEKTQSLPIHSNLRLYNHLQDENGDIFCNIFRPYGLTNRVRSNQFLFKTYTISEDDWFDNMSQLEYNIPDLWWLIPTTNDYNNPYEDINEGTNILFLKDSYIHNVFDDLITIERL